MPSTSALPATENVTTSSRPHRAARLEDTLVRDVARLLWSRGWRTRIEPFVGYGAPGWVRVLARTVLSPRGDHPVGRDALAPRDPLTQGVRGWRTLATAQVPGVRVRVRAGTLVHEVISDRGGYLDEIVRSDLPPGWHDVELTVPTGTVTARVQVIDPAVRTGIVSDIDDTVMVTSVPRPLLAIWNTFVLRDDARRPVSGMAALYRDLVREEPRTPVVYLSTGAWNAAPALGRFLTRHGYPSGPLLLTDWGPTNSGWFRSGAQHKRDSLERLTRELPQVRWLLIGDDGQRDPEVYAETADSHPGQVRAVAIRRLTPGEQTLAHGAPTPLPDQSGARRRTVAAGVPVVTGADGAQIGRALAALSE